MSEEKRPITIAGNIGFCGGLCLLFIGLKLTGFLNTWSWWWVLSPLWGPVAFVLAILFLVAAAAVLFLLIKYFLKLRREKAAEREKRETRDASAHGLGTDRDDVDNMLKHLRDRE